MAAYVVLVAALTLAQPGQAPVAAAPEVELQPLDITVQVIPPTAPATLTPAAPPVRPKESPPDRWWMMRELQGTWLGAWMDDNRLSVSGWVEGSFNASTDAVANNPVVWDDRANRFLLEQAWFRMERGVAAGGTEPTFGFRIDALAGSDYRFTLPRGLFNSQLVNSTGAQNLYGVDLVQQFVNAYLPTLFEGTEFRLGRMYTPFGIESIEAVSTPLISHSYSFNWSPFTQFGLGAYMTFTPEWSGVLMLVNGNDVYIGDASEEVRFTGNVKWTQPGGRNTVTLTVLAGRGKFNAGSPFGAATTSATAAEPLGRNNLNVVDLVSTHTFGPVLAYNLEAQFGYQTNVPGIASATGYGTADYVSAAHYFFYSITPRLTGIFRFENYDDFQGQRTGFQGLYTAATAGLAFKLRKGLTVRTELRYDYNRESAPFEGKHQILTAASDFIVRW